VTLAGLEPETAYTFRVASTDPAGNGPTASAAAAFVTAAATPVGLAAAAVEAVTPAAVTVSWTTAKPATGTVRAVAAGVERTAAAAEPRLAQTVTVAGLAPETAYQLTVEAVDACGAAATATLAATTPAAPASLDLSGWRLVNDNPQFEFTFPAGTVIAAGGYLVVGRANDRAGFEAAWGPLDPAAAYLDSGDELIVNATPRPYTLLDAGGAAVDGPTVTIARDASKARRDACLDAGLATAWEARADDRADPGRGAPAACGAGVVITEMSDAGDYRNEFVELRFDAGSTP
jgi:hypothetical protein